MGELTSMLPEDLGPEGFDAWVRSVSTAIDNPELVSHVHVQDIPSAAWVINHPLEGYPSVTIVDSAGEVVEGAVFYVSESIINVEFAGAFGGSAYLS